MHKQHKDLLKVLVAALRRRLAGTWDAAGNRVRGDLDHKLEQLGFAPNGDITPIDALVKPTGDDRRAYQAADAAIAPFVGEARRQARAEFAERAAYTWINRLLALRTLEARELIDETLRPNPAYGGASEALYLLQHSAAAERTLGADGGWQAVIDDAGGALVATLPGLFDPTDLNAALRPTPPALLDCIHYLGGQLSNATYAVDTVDAMFRDPDVLGWAYECYQEDANSRVRIKLGNGGKIETRAEIAAATQLFTEPYMVKWLLQNSLGRCYHEAYPESRLPDEWEYYIRNLPQAEPGAGEGNGETQPDKATIFPLEKLTLLDPCMGSGHILREGFDMLFAMQREQHPDLGTAEIARRVLSEHLFGIDIDPRAAQIAALTLVLRAWERVRQEDPQFSLDRAKFTLNLATTPILAPGALERHLKQHPEDVIYRPILTGVFGALEQAHLLGSLLRPEQHLDDAIVTLRKERRAGGQLGLVGESTTANALHEELDKHAPGELKRLLLERVNRSFAREAVSADVGMQMLGREAGAGVHLLRLLGQRYAVVCTNPPYMGSKNMSTPLKTYVENKYLIGKRDLYATFVLRCIEMCDPDGCVALVTLHTFITAKAFKALRKQLLDVGCIRNLVHLGTGTLKSLSNPNAQGFCMYALKIGVHDESGCSGVFIRLVDVEDKNAHLLTVVSSQYEGHPRLFVKRLSDFLRLPDHQFVYWVTPQILGRLGASEFLSSFANVPKGLTTADNKRFLRMSWETSTAVWSRYAKGGGYRKWTGLQWYMVNWSHNGRYIRAFDNSVIRNERYYEHVGLTYTEVANGSLGVRFLAYDELFDARSPAIIPDEKQDILPLLGILNTRICTYFFRCLASGPLFDQAYAPNLPIPSKPWPNLVSVLADFCLLCKDRLLWCDPIERSFDVHAVAQLSQNQLQVELLLLMAEAVLEKLVFGAFELSQDSVQSVTAETGIPVGWLPVVTGQYRLPDISDMTPPQKGIEAVTHFVATHAHHTPAPADMSRIRSSLRSWYEVGPGSAADDAALEDNSPEVEEEAVATGAHIPIPTETFLEELSVKLQINPISVFWLLEELRAEGARCKPEEKRLLEDRLSVLVLRLLGHRWPKQIEVDEPIPTWADADGVIPLTTYSNEPTLTDRMRERLRAEGGDLGLQRTEALLLELTGQTLSEWLRRTFFRRHVSQFKKRPIAWHLASRPQRAGGGVTREPVFECMVYYHRTDSDILARIRNHYVEPLLARERGIRASAQRSTPPDATAAAAANERIQELEAFAERLRQVEDQGFVCTALDDLLATEPLDRWSGDGVLPPADFGTLLAQEGAWQVDINDGVRVNIAPLQAAGLLTSDVLAARDVPKAIADRARWRADERRWVRAGKLPRCGWMSEDAPESPKWKELAPEREQERERLAEKRRVVKNALGV